MMIQRAYVCGDRFAQTVKKIYGQEMKLVHSVALLRFGKKLEEEIKEASKVYQEFKDKAEGDEAAKQEFNDYFNEKISLPDIPKSILEEPEIKLSAEDVAVFEHVLN